MTQRNTLAVRRHSISCFITLSAFALLSCGDATDDPGNSSTGDCVIQAASEAERANGDYKIVCDSRTVGYMQNSPPSESGKDGIDGKHGTDGKDGIDGKHGTDGKDGIDGKHGTDGKDGIDGKHGTDGIDGKHGTDGKDGIDGKHGTDGEHGTSCAIEETFGIEQANGAYKIICGGTFIGYLQNGENGKDGKDGENGKNGDNGQNGQNGQNGENCAIEPITGGYKITCGNDVGYVYNGTQGEAGAQGPQGNQGTDCDVESDGAYFVMKCGGVEKAKWAKAMCGAAAYDPEVHLCQNGTIIYCGNFKDGTARLHQGKNKAQFCDKRDGTVYVYVDIGEQTWMAQNLNYSGENGKMGRCFRDDPENCETLGRLYTLDEMFCSGGDCELLQWGVANPIDHSVNIACPIGWHLPSTTELEELLTYSDHNFTPGYEGSGRGNNSAATKLRVTSTDGTDEFGFSALPGGFCGGGCPATGARWTTLYPSTITDPIRSTFWWSHAYGSPVPLAKSWHISTVDNGNQIPSNFGGVTAKSVDDAMQSYSTSRFYARCLKDKTPSSKTPEPAPPQTLACGGTGATGQQCHFGKWKDYFTDSRDGKKYPYVTIGGKTWMAANLNYSKDETIGKCYNNLNDNCDNYGRLYNYEAAVSTSNEVCPSGWRLPTDAEWTALTREAGGTGTNNLVGAAKKLKAKSGWGNSKSSNGTTGIDGTDDYGFAALPGSYGNLRKGNYGEIIDFASARGGFWWSAGSVAANGAQIRHLGPTLDDVTRVDNDKSRMYSVRCVSDKSFCNGQPYSEATEFCQDGTVKPLCNGKNYSKTEFCYEESMIGQYCGDRTDTYNPDLYECNSAVNLNGIYLKAKPIDGDGNEYNAVLIGTQTWMAENLNYAVEGSLCYNNDEILCETYGRLYKKGMADNACPSGWHLPSADEWKKLLHYVDGTSSTAGDYNYASPTAGLDLKATSDWNSYNDVSGNGTDAYGFSALPGGESYGSDYSSLKTTGYWWTSTTQSIYYLIARMMHSNNVAETRYEDFHQYYHISVRCVKD